MSFVLDPDFAPTAQPPQLTNPFRPLIEVRRRGYWRNRYLIDQVLNLR